ncbi:Chromosome partitioning ATPase, Mrp family, contains Fe-S cluster [Geosporobacter subterraneus DSM 17957]|uniref:Iron-sulfur cluster carrier protein n=1 Tax=Geosporobacter subterraneus DSM 17957 TaxID=1121919 RepID=A0A1M6D100_9FIRM|nr:Mrp/NBP35 family ATP-binding protein [Geosporobacter subterraneus]SHI66962.1 Chromosome partitioning ATPase, Mrp family, contains Fe-S cluster [Geosporobacter subterraneus DSM 17957]
MDIQKEKTNQFTNIKNIIAVMSGKGGVGKSSVTSLMGVTLKNKGYKVGILDADITGPSIPKIFGVNKKRAVGMGNEILPVETTTGIKIMSINLLVDQEDAPVVWRGPLVANMVKQFYTDVLWGDLDYLLIDLPPGTGDVPLTIMQSFEIDGIVIVSTPQDLAKLIVTKSMNMAKMMNVPILGVIENMSYFQCPECNKRHNVFGSSNIEDMIKAMDVSLIGRIPIDPELVGLCDEGKIELYEKINFAFGEEFGMQIENILGGIKQ